MLITSIEDSKIKTIKKARTKTCFFKYKDNVTRKEQLSKVALQHTHARARTHTHTHTEQKRSLALCVRVQYHQQ